MNEAPPPDEPDAVRELFGPAVDAEPDPFETYHRATTIKRLIGAIPWGVGVLAAAGIVAGAAWAAPVGGGPSTTPAPSGSPTPTESPTGTPSPTPTPTPTPSETPSA